MTMETPQLVECYVKIRDAKAAAKKAFEKETKRMTDAMTKLDGLLTKALADAGGVESIVTEFGTVYTKTRSSCSVKDREAFYNFAVASGNLGAIDMKANAPAVRELLDAGTKVPGVKFSESSYIGIRRK